MPMTTLKEIQDEIARLQAEQDKFLSPDERAQRSQRRAQILGEWAAPKFAWNPEQLEQLRRFAETTGEDWLFTDEVLSADGISPDDAGRVRFAQSSRP